MELCVRGFLAARKRMDEVLALVALMEDSSLPCFSVASVAKALLQLKDTKYKTLLELKKRFYPGSSEMVAADMMKKIVRYAEDNHFTNVYDDIQHHREDIWYPHNV